MAPFIDARIPLIFGELEEAGPNDALLIEGGGEDEPGRDWFLPEPESVHPAGCACCQRRNAASLALTRLMLARGRGAGPFFSRVIVIAVSEAGQHAVRTALENDPIASAYFKEG